MSIPPCRPGLRSPAVWIALAGLLAGGCASMQGRAAPPGVADVAGCYQLAYEPWPTPQGRRALTPTDSLPSTLELRADRLAGWPHFEAGGVTPYVARARHRDGSESAHFRYWSFHAPDSVFVSVPLPLGSVDLHLRWSGGDLRGHVRRSSDNLSDVDGSMATPVAGRRAPCEGAV